MVRMQVFCQKRKEENDNFRRFYRFPIPYLCRPSNYYVSELFMKGPWLPVLLEEEDGCSELLIRCANTVA